MRARLLVILALAARTALADVTVDTTVDEDVDDGACSLREAIVAANTDASYHGCVRSAAAVDTVDFDLGTGTPTIAVTGSDLPGFTQPVIVNGATGGATRVEIAGGGTHATGLAVTGDGSEVRNLVINGFTSRQLYLSNGSGIVVQGNLLGTNAAGSAFVTGSMVGIEVCTGLACATSDAHQIGGAAAGQRNVVAALATAILLSGSASTVIQGNFINTDVTGTQLLVPHTPTGIGVWNASDTVIGGPGAGEGNVVAGFNPIVITGNPAGPQSSGTVVQGNHIGTDVTGTVDLGSGGDGVTLAHAIATQIGGLVAGAGNVISGNAQGIAGGSSGVSGGSVDDTTVQGNFIGTDAAGTGALANSSIGINLGDDAVIEGNVIAFNGADGIEVNCGACIQRITGNAIHTNGGLGIDLNGGSDGVTPNDAADGDTGPNGRQNFPVLDGFFLGGTSIDGTLDSTPSTTFRVEIFANDGCDLSGNGEGRELVGFENDVTTDANGDADFTVALSQSVPAGKVMTATAIAPDGSTSEFSPCPPAPSTTTTTSSTSTTPPPTTTASSTSTAPPTTEPPATTTSSSSTTAAPSTSGSSSSSTVAASSTTSSSLPVATTTSTSTPLASTTTTVPAGCAGVPDGPTFASIDCRLGELLARLNAETGLEQLGPKLVRSVEKARMRSVDAEDRCRVTDAKKAKRRLQQAATALGQYLHRLNGRAARKRVEPALRQSLADEGSAIQQDVRTLRAAVRCPDDAA